MDFECAICLEQLYRPRPPNRNETYSNMLQALIRHKHLREPRNLLMKLGFDFRCLEFDDNSTNKLLHRLKRAMKSTKMPLRVLSVMYSYMRIMGTPCGHIFHFWCLEDWNQRRFRFIFDCPCCRQKYLPDQMFIVKLGSPEEEDNNMSIAVVMGPSCSVANAVPADIVAPVEDRAGDPGPIEPAPEPKRFVLSSRIVKSLQILIPIILFLKFFWDTQHHMKELEKMYDEGEDEDLKDEFYMDSYLAIRMLIYCLICLMMDGVFSFFGDNEEIQNA